MSNEVGHIKAFVPYSGPNTTKSDVISDQQWETLRALIELMYIDEKKTFNAVAEFLSEHHNIKPTKKQFIRVITKWGLQKNIKRSERRAIVASFDQGNNFVGDTIKGRKLDRAKLERWRKRDGLPGAIPGRNSGAEAEAEEDEDEDEEVEKDVRMDDDIPMDTPLVQDSTESFSTQRGFETNLPEMNIWKTVGILDSPRLTRLFGLLSLLDLEDMHPLDLSRGEGTVNENWELEVELGLTSSSDEDGHIVMTEGASSKIAAASFSTNSTFQFLSKLATTGSSQMATRHYTMAPQPFYELDPFPANDRSREISRYAIWEYGLDVPSRPRALTKNQCLTKLRRMGETRVPDVKLLDEMWTVAQNYRQQRNYSAAELWYRRIVFAKQSVPRFRPFETLKACLAITHMLDLQEKVLEAYNLLSGLHVKIMQELKPHDTLALYSLTHLLELTFIFGKYEEVERLGRDILQITISTFGVKSRETMRSMLNLGRIPRGRGRYSGGELLLRRLLHQEVECVVHRKLDSNDVNIVDTTTELAIRLRIDGRIDEARDLLEAARERYGTDINNTGVRLAFEYELARLMFERKAYADAEVAVREVLSSTSTPLNLIWRSEFLKLLARALRRAGRAHEAGHYYNEAFVAFERTRGLKHPTTMNLATDIGYCYADQGLYDEALLHYQGILDKLALFPEKDSKGVDECIQRVRTWMSEISQEKDECASDNLNELGQN